MDMLKELVGSRKFWAALIAVVLVVLGGLYKDFPDIGAHSLEVAAMLGAYVVATGLDPNTGSLGTVFTSRKFWATTAGLIALLAKTFVPSLPFDEVTITAFIVTMSTYVIGVGLADSNIAK